MKIPKRVLINPKVLHQLPEQYICEQISCGKFISFESNNFKQIIMKYFLILTLFIMNYCGDKKRQKEDVSQNPSEIKAIKEIMKITKEIAAI